MSDHGHEAYLSISGSTQHKAVLRYGNEPCPHGGEWVGVNPETGDRKTVVRAQTLKKYCGDCMAGARAIVKAEEERDQQIEQQEERITRLEEEIAQLRDEGGPGRGNTE